MKYELSDQTKNNLLAFLQRTDLKGSEVASFVEIIQCLNSPVNEDIENK